MSSAINGAPDGDPSARGSVETLLERPAPIEADRSAPVRNAAAVIGGSLLPWRLSGRRA